MSASETLTRTVDDELGVQLGSIIEVATRDGTQKRRNAAYKHLSYFVQKYCGSVRAENWKEIPLNDMTESLIQRFATYLVRFATQGMKSGSPLISYNTADTILSQKCAKRQYLSG
ncbi:hypothetical protein AC1031_010539 [Aphanomyces cochlioides]|nr:hypothetical protein AC1031_010539 [Aphanomyces cochlioides]